MTFNKKRYRTSNRTLHNRGLEKEKQTYNIYLPFPSSWNYLIDISFFKQIANLQSKTTSNSSIFCISRCQTDITHKPNLLLFYKT